MDWTLQVRGNRRSTLRRLRHETRPTRRICASRCSGHLASRSSRSRSNDTLQGRDQSVRSRPARVPLFEHQSTLRTLLTQTAFLIQKALSPPLLARALPLLRALPSTP